MVRRIFICLLIVCIVVTNLIGCKKEVLDESFFALDTIITIKLYNYKSKKKAIEYLNFCKKTITELEEKLSRTKETSDVYLYNQGLKNEEELDDTIKDIINNVEVFNVNISPFFDIYLGRLVEIWDEAKKNNVVANRADIIVSYAEKKKMDLGGVAKGYITDILVKNSSNYGIIDCIINLGGNVYVIGDKNKEEYSVGIAKPFGEGDNDVIDVVKCKNTSVVTSGVYQRYYKIDGDDTIYHHIIDKKTGFPVKSDILSASIICENSTLADMLSTTCVLEGLNKVEELIEKSKQFYNVPISAIIVTDKNNVIKY